MRIYLASPYTHDDPVVMQERFEAVCRAAGKIMQDEGHVVFSPIAHSHNIAIYNDLPKEWEFWEKQDREYIDWCDEVWILWMEGVGTSVGVRAEWEYAKETGKSVKIISPHWAGNS